MRQLTVLMLVTLALAGGCGSPTVSHHQPTDADPPFGGGFPAQHRPGGDPTAANDRRGEVRVGFAGPGQDAPRATNRPRPAPVELEEYDHRDPQGRRR